MRCLAKDPAERPRSVAALADELRETGLAAGWTAADAARWWSKSRPPPPPKAAAPEAGAKTLPAGRRARRG